MSTAHICYIVFGIASVAGCFLGWLYADIHARYADMARRDKEQRQVKPAPPIYAEHRSLGSYTTRLKSFRQ